MSKRHSKQRGGSGDRGVRQQHNIGLDPFHQDSVIRRLAELFQDSFDMEIIHSVAQTCQWDFGKATEALIVLGGTTQPTSRRSRRINSLVDSSSSSSTRHKTKSLPSTLKGHKSSSGRLSDSSTHSMPNGLRAHPAYFSNDSLSSNQVWQRHYKSKPQSPGLLTMIPPAPKDASKISKPGSSRSSSRASSIKDLQRHKELPEVKEAGQVILRIEKLVQSNVKVMIVMRGVPGSGKTHLAQVVVQMVAANDRGQHVFSTDDYFVMLGRGIYNYDPNQISQAHSWNQKRVSEALRRAVNPVVVDNTNTQAWEMKPYIAMGVQHGYHIEVLEPVTPWRNKEAELVRRNVHNVPREKIRQMLDRYEPGWTGDKLLNLFQLKYQHCGAAHVSPEITNFTNSPLAQHRLHSMEQPEKPKRKKASPGKKDRRHVPGVEINTNQEQQLEELNKIFAEYGKTIDPESRQKVLDAGVPIFEVVTRIRKMQGTVLPLPGIPPSITEEEPSAASPPVVPPEPTPAAAAAPDYFGINRQSPTDSIEPDTMSSSNSSETSECESDSEPEPLRRYLDDCGGGGHFVDGEDQWEDEEEVKSEGAVSGPRTNQKGSGLVTSSQEELSIIDYQLSTPAGSSQDELSLLEYQRGCTPNNASSSSSEEPKTELSTLQDSLRDVLLRSAASHHSEPAGQLLRDIASHTGSCASLADLAKAPEETCTSEAKDQQMPIRDTVDNVDVALEDDQMEHIFDKLQISKTNEDEVNSIELNDSLMDILKRRFHSENVIEKAPDLDQENNVVCPQTAKSPDLEEIPLPRLPDPGEEKAGKMRPKLETILESAQSPPDTELPSVQPAKKGGLLQHVFDSINWSNMGLEKIMEAPKPQLPPKPQSLNRQHKETFTEPSDFDLWRNNGTYKVLLSSSRVINDPDTPLPIRSKSTVAMFDKGTETVEEDAVVDREGLQVLAAMFPDVPLLDLADLLDKCQYDIQWVAELITDPSYTMEHLPNISAQPDKPKETDSKLDLISDGKKTIKRRKDRKGHKSELTQLLKKEIESSFQISNEHYSDHVLLIKKVREGQVSLDEPVESMTSETCPVVEEPTIEAVPCGAAEAWPTVGTTRNVGGVAGWEGEQLMSMPLEPSFFQELVNRFGNPGVVPVEPIKGYTPVVQIPESLGRALYWLWVESLNDQVENAQDMEEEDLTAADALLAAALQEEEMHNRQTTMQELVDMDLAERLMLNEHQRASGTKTDTVAAVLSKKLLLDKYPYLDKEALLAVFNTEGCSLQRACDTLHALYGPPRVTGAVPNYPPPPPLQTNTVTHKKPLIVVKEPAVKNSVSESDVLIVDPSAFRLEVQQLQQRRVEYQRLGKEEMAKKNYAVASHFFHEARRLKAEIQEAQSTSISQHPFPLPVTDTLPTTIDLHYLFTGEAVQFVDLFLDLHITRLPSGRIELFLITGRGKNSLSGASKIKPVVQKRLIERQLSFVEDNPGMLRVSVHANDLLSTAL